MNLIGHGDKLSKLIEAEASGRLAHAYLFAGMEGIGKRLTALEFASFIYCRNPGTGGRACRDCDQCKKVDHRNHPDLFFLEVLEGKKDISVEQTRELQSMIQMRPVEGKYKIVIIDNAERMHGAAANSMLKTLEEPPEWTLFFIITSRLNMLLPTVISRCQKIVFSLPPEKEEVELIAKTRSVDKDTASFLLRVAGGSLGGAISFSAEEMDETVEEIGRVWRTRSPKEILAVSERWGKKDKDEEESGDRYAAHPALSVLMALYHGILLKKEGRTFVFPAALKELAEKEERSQPEEMIRKKVLAIASAQKDVEGTYNKQLMFEQLLFTLAL